ncbi:MAG TPA: ATP-dependent RNA helicase HrpA [Mycobacteriales bacterium]|jgi:ATP-dependent helicase HrpA|nr:ATP-dependent RNA helicase HrpA [Mycobacteriales bacterium]
MSSSLAELRARLPELTLRDEFRLRRRLDGVRGDAVPDGLEDEIDKAAARVERRRAAIPAVSYPPQLPISARRDDILAAVRDNQVVVIAGETGSGKTTQLPKICLELGRGVRGVIGHTQPRRIAARTVSERIAEELGVELGSAVGYQVRFTDRAGEDTAVKVMTDGILLAEIQHDRMLRRYDTLIIDEAHERSLNIDFLLGYLRQLLPRRPDLKVIITSATIDPQRFSAHFGDAPILEVSGRTYPVEVRYREPAEDADQIEAITAAVGELGLEAPGDVLVFLSGEREIRDTADALRKSLPETTEVLPLFARLSAADQHKVFASHSGRRVVLATNVAETSLTVPGIRYVVDPGTARISRYSLRTKVQRLPIERVSQASADQRKGRCGRTADGICIRLYSEEDFESRPRFTEPEVQRTNLASVILQMTALGLGDVGAFPFVDPPDRRAVADGVALLHELGALEAGTGEKRRLTPVGRKLAQLPIDPRLGRMVLAAEGNGCLHEVLVITAALSIQDPRERPVEKQEAADTMHRRFADPTSDFMTLLNLWNYIEDRQDALSSSAFRRLCTAEFLHYLRVREWQDLYGQLRSILRQLGTAVPRSPAEVDPKVVTRSLLAGLLSHLGLREDTGPRSREYAGARGARFAVWPGSALAKQPPRWVVAAELVETSRLWARTVAKVEPEWAEELAGHLAVRFYNEPHWSKRRGGVVATERVTLFGLPIVVGRTVDYARIDPQLSRELFLRHALVEGDWQSQHAFLATNRALLEDVEELEHRTRRRGLVVDDNTLFDFYDSRVPADVVSGRHFDAWWKQARRTDPNLLTFTREMLVPDDVDTADTPDEWTQGGLTLPVAYRFEPGAADDGVIVEVPLAALNRVRPDGFDWQVPALREELVTALIRSLPKPLRRNFVPAPDAARAILAQLEPGREPLVEALARELRRASGQDVPITAFDWAKVPAHLRATFRVTDGARTVAEGKDLEQLQRRLGRTVQDVLSGAARTLERTGLTSWTVGTVPRTFEAGGLVGYPSLVDEGATVALRVLPTEPEQRAAMWAGVRRLLLLGVPSPLKWVSARLDNRAKLALTNNPHGSLAALLADCAAAAADEMITEAGGPPWDAEGFAKLADRIKAELNERVLELLRGAQQVIGEWAPLVARLGVPVASPLQPALNDLKLQVRGLIGPGFVAATGRRRLPDLRRYLAAAAYRLDRLPGDTARDSIRMGRVQAAQQELDSFLAALPPGRREADEVRQLRWMVEELRVSLFAQSLGTPYPVSEQRIYRAMDQLG